jgi:streptogramin lyase
MTSKTATTYSSLLAIVPLCVATFLLPASCRVAEGEPITPAPAALSGPSWMYDSRDVIGNRRLTDIVIPGTHDSGTYGITWSSEGADDGKGVSVVIAWINHVETKWYGGLLDIFGVLDFVRAAASDITSWWARTQRASFPTQLEDGIRYFDLRVQQVGGSYYCVHSLLGANLEDLFTGIQDLYGNPASSHEILFLDFQHTFDMDNASFVALLKTVLRDRNGNSLMIPRGADLTLNSIWATDQRIVVFFDDDATVAAHPELWYSSSSRTSPQIFSPWPNTNDPQVLFDFLSQPLDIYVDAARKSGTFVVLQSLSTEGFVNVASSIEAHVDNALCYVEFLCPILRRLGYDHLGPMSFFDFNFGGIVLADFLDNSGGRAAVMHRANIIIIDDYGNFSYNKSGGGCGGYLDLVNEMNTGRAAASPKGPYHGVVTSQTANFTANHYQSYPVEVDFINTGSVAWDPSVVFLGTAAPYNRTTNLSTSDGWVSETRIKMQNTSPVQPGQVAVFKFSIMPDDGYATSFQSFELVADQAYQSYPVQWFGDFYGNTAIYIQTDPLYYRSQLKSKGGNTSLATFDTTTLTATFNNTGNMPWFPDTVFLGLQTPQFSSYYDATGDWESPTRIRMQNTSAVMPGQDAVFTFDATASLQATGGSYTLQLVADKAAGLAPRQWFGSPGNVTWNIALTPVTQPGVLTGQLVSRSPDTTITRGQPQTLELVFENTGKITWYPDIAFLRPQGGAANLYTSDGNWLETASIAMQNTQPVKPGEQATFSFAATPNADFQSGSQTFQVAMSVPAVWGADVAGAAGSIYVTVRGNVPFATPSVWVANYSDGTVTRLNSSTGAALGTYGVGYSPAGVAVDGAGNVWITNMGANTVSKLNGANGSTLGTYAVGSSPAGVAVDASGNVWVANTGANTVSKLNGSSGAILGTYIANSQPNGIAVDASGDVWVTNSGQYNATVTRLNPRTGGIVGTYTVGTSPFGIAVDASSHVWVTNLADSTVTKLNGATGSTLATYSVGNSPAGVAVDACDDVWVASEGSGTVTKIRGSDGVTLGTYDVGNVPFGVSVDAFGNIWVTNSTGGTVTKLNGLNGSTLGTYNVGRSPTSLGDMTGFALQYFVLNRTLTIVTASLAAGNVSYNYDETVFASGGTLPYTWRIDSGSLPAGVSLAAGRISGTPTKAETSTFTVRVTDGGGASVTHDYSIVVHAASSSLAIAPMDLPPGTVGEYYSSETFRATGGTIPYTWTIESGSLPDGLSLNPTGTISGIPTAEGVATFRIRATEDSGASADQELSILVNPCSPLAISPVNLLLGRSGTYYQSDALTASGGLAPYSWRIVSGSLPAGLSLNPDGVISGTPTEEGTSDFAVEVTDSRDATAIRQMSILVFFGSPPRRLLRPIAAP